jgi:outer membrane protein assembly factor BamE (lipoprotein component of BamABCDE complex)
MTNRICWWTVAAASVVLAAPLAAQGTLAPISSGSAAAQDTSGPVRPGMTEAQVVARWGEPLAVRRLNDWTYLFYGNGHERQVGYDDTVFLQNDQVMDAIVRSPDHPYAGQSSSPEGRAPEFTPPAAPPDSAAGAAVTGVRVNPGR